MHPCNHALPSLFMTLFMFPLVLPLKVSEGTACLIGCAISFFYQPATFNLTVNFIVKSDGDILFFLKIRHVLPLVSTMS